MVEAGSGLSASQRTRRRQFLFRNGGPPVLAGDVAFNKMFARGAATMPFGHAAFHSADIRLARHQAQSRRQPAEQQRKHRRRQAQSGEDSFSSVLVHRCCVTR